jgi:hypothetical protein
MKQHKDMNSVWFVFEFPPYMLILIHNFLWLPQSSKWGWTRVKNCLAWIRFNPCYALFNITAVWFSLSKRLSVQCIVPPPISLTPPVFVLLNSKSPALWLNHLAPLWFLNHNKLAPSPITIARRGPCLCSPEGLRLCLRLYWSACERTFPKKSKLYWLKSIRSCS